MIPKEQAIQYGPETLTYWSRCNELSIKDGKEEVVSARWPQAYPSDDSSCGGAQGNS